MDPKQLREQRAKLIAEARALVEKATAESRDMTSDEDAQFDKMLAEAESLKVKFDRAEKLEVEERDLAQSQGTVAGQQDAGAEGVPNGLGAGGLPTGLLFTGRAWCESRLIALAADYQVCINWHLTAPPSDENRTCVLETTWSPLSHPHQMEEAS